MMDRKQLGNILDLIDLTYPGKLRVSDPKVFMETWFSLLQEYDYSLVMNNLKEHVKSSPYVPSIHDLITDKTKQKNEGRYVPDVKTTYIEIQQKERENQLALTTSAPGIGMEQILAAKEKALKKIANAVKKSEEENPYKVVE